MIRNKETPGFYNRNSGEFFWKHQKDEINKGNIQLKSGWVIKNYLCDRPDVYKFYTELCEHDVYWHDQTDDFDFSNGPDCYSGFTNDYLRFIHNTGFKGGLWN